MKKIATKIAKILEKYNSAKMTNLAEYMDLRDTLITVSRELYSENDLDDPYEEYIDLQYAIYLSAHNLLSFVIEMMSGGLPSFDKHNKIGMDATDDYMPSWPPMSPISRSFFNTWLSFDLRLDVDQESYTSCVVELGKPLGIDSNFCHLFNLMDQSRLGVYKVLDKIGNKAILEEIFTKRQYLYFNPNLHELACNELCLLRLFLPINGTFNYHISIESPYILASREDEWQDFFARNILVKRGTPAAEVNYEKFMKSGLNNCYWLEYVMQGYIRHTDLVIYLKGVPDIAASRPHTFNNNILPERK